MAGGAAEPQGGAQPARAGAIPESRAVTAIFCPKIHWIHSLSRRYDFLGELRLR
jgi:hypothetical protein